MDNTTILVSVETRQKLNILKSVHGFDTYDDLISDLIRKGYGSTISISLDGGKDDTDSGTTE